MVSLDTLDPETQFQEGRDQQHRRTSQTSRGGERSQTLRSTYCMSPAKNRVPTQDRSYSYRDGDYRDKAGSRMVVTFRFLI